MDGPQDHPDQATLTEWVIRGGNSIRIVETACGALLRQNRELLRYVPGAERARFRRDSRIKDTGENSIRELADKIRDTLSRDATGLVLFEDASVMKMDFGPYVRVMTTWSFAVALERLEVIPSASELFDRIEDTGRTPPRQAFDRPSAAGAERISRTATISPDGRSTRAGHHPLRSAPGGMPRPRPEPRGC